MLSPILDAHAGEGEDAPGTDRSGVVFLGQLVLVVMDIGARCAWSGLSD